MYTYIYIYIYIYTQVYVVEEATECGFRFALERMCPCVYILMCIHIMFMYIYIYTQSNVVGRGKKF